MSDTKQRWPRAVALEVADALRARLKPFCDELMVAGSIRRRKPTVGDIELLYIPRFAERPADLFTTKQVSLADEEIERMLADGTLTKRLSKAGFETWGALNKLAVHSSGLPVDLFASYPQNWSNALVCRTGPAESNARIATLAQRNGYKWNVAGMGFTRLSDGAAFPMDSERAVFEFVGLPYAEPWLRL